MKEVLKCAYLDTYAIGVLLQMNRHDLIERKEFKGEEYFRLVEEVNSREIILDFIDAYRVLRDLEDY